MGKMSAHSCATRPTPHRLAGDGAEHQHNEQNILYSPRNPGDDATDQALVWLLHRLRVPKHPRLL